MLLWRIWEYYIFWFKIKMTQFPLKRKQNWNNSGEVKSIGLVKIYIGKQSELKKSRRKHTGEIMDMSCKIQKNIFWTKVKAQYLQNYIVLLRSTSIFYKLSQWWDNVWSRKNEVGRAVINELIGFSAPIDILIILYVIISVLYVGVPIRCHFTQKGFLFWKSWN